MDFKQTLLLVINEMNNQKVEYGLIGGFAMGLYGVDRPKRYKISFGKYFA